MMVATYQYIIRLQITVYVTNLVQLFNQINQLNSNFQSVNQTKAVVNIHKHVFQAHSQFFHDDKITTMVLAHDLTIIKALYPTPIMKLRVPLNSIIFDILHNLKFVIIDLGLLVDFQDKVFLVQWTELRSEILDHHRVVTFHLKLHLI